jgi:hypothetical protein
MTLRTDWLPRGLRGVAEMILACVALLGMGIALQAWVDSRAHAAVEGHAASEGAVLQSVREDIAEIKQDVKSLLRGQP